MRRLAALSAAIVIAFQLTVNYWFYAYVTWFEPLVFVSLLLAINEKTRLDGCRGDVSRSGVEPLEHPVFVPGQIVRGRQI